MWPYISNLFQEGLPGDKGKFYLRIVKNESKFVDMGGGVNGAKDGTNLLAGEVKHQPFAPVLTDERNFILVLHRHIIRTDTKVK